MELFSAILTLFFILDPIGNIPLFIGQMQELDQRRRTWVVARENIFALLILCFFLFFGPALTTLLHIGRPALYISGGVLLFIISLGMIFPGLFRPEPISVNSAGGEPFLVPLATPFVAGPSSMATLMVFTSGRPERIWEWFFALLVAWGFSTVILMLSAALSRLLGPRVLQACERLMGMILTVIAVQMFLNGLTEFSRSETAQRTVTPARAESVLPLPPENVMILNWASAHYSSLPLVVGKGVRAC
jgi:multiple antibiotic resistance protein